MAATTKKKSPPSKGEITLAELLETDFLRCCHCKGDYSRPVLLPCLHSLCEGCVPPCPPNTPPFTCPLCQAQIAPSNGRPATLPNPFLASLCRIRSYKHGDSSPNGKKKDSSESEPRFCQYCKFVGKTQAAVALCIDCQDDMCGECQSAHERTRVTRGHKVAPYAQIRNGLYDHDMRSASRLFCPAHDDQPYAHFCENCQVPVCAVCRQNSHGSHLVNSAEKAREKHLPQLQKLAKGVEESAGPVAEYCRLLADKTKSLAQDEKTTRAAILKHAEELHRLVDAHRDRLLAELDSVCQAEQATLTKHQGSLQTAEASLRRTAEFLQHLLRFGTTDEVLAMYRPVVTRLNQLAKMKPDGPKAVVVPSFRAGQASKDSVAALFGSLDLPRAVLSARAGMDPSLAAQTLLPPFKDSPVLKSSFTATGEKDGRDVWPTGLAVTKDQHYVIVDRANKAVKLFSPEGKLQRQLSSRGADNSVNTPFDAAVLPSGDVAVTDDTDNAVKVFSPSGEKRRTISGMFQHPRGLAVDKSGRLLVVDCRRCHVTVHDPQTGDVVTTLDACDKAGNKVLVDPFYIAVTHAGNIVVTDQAAPNVKLFGPKGDFLGGFGSYGMNREQVLQPHGVCGDRHGYIFLADQRNERIHVLLPDGSFAEPLLTKKSGLNCPVALTIDPEGHLVVAESAGKINVFEYLDKEE